MTRANEQFFDGIEKTFFKLEYAIDKNMNEKVFD